MGRETAPRAVNGRSIGRVKVKWACRVQGPGAHKAVARACEQVRFLSVAEEPQPLDAGAPCIRLYVYRVPP